MSNPIRTLGLAVMRQALVDYARGTEQDKKMAEEFLKGEGRKLWIALGLRAELLDELLENPAGIGIVFLAGRRVIR